MQKLIIANFKMNATKNDIAKLIEFYSESIQDTTVICLPYPYFSIFNQINTNHNVILGAQNVSDFEEGAYTGEVSAEMLSDFGVKYCIVGHAERRMIYKENNMHVFNKIKQLLKYNIKPILCVGENAKQRNEGLILRTLRKQISCIFKKLSIDEINKIVIAYEPVWAIQNNTEMPAEEANNIFFEIQKTVNYIAKCKMNTQVLYGGNVTKENAKLFLQQANIHGVLVGKESLNPKNFISICYN